MTVMGAKQPYSGAGSRSALQAIRSPPMAPTPSPICGNRAPVLTLWATVAAVGTEEGFGVRVRIVALPCQSAPRSRMVEAILVWHPLSGHSITLRQAEPLASLAHGVDSDQRAFQFEAPKQHRDSGDLVGFDVGRLLAENKALARRPGRGPYMAGCGRSCACCVICSPVLSSQFHLAVNLTPPHQSLV